VAAAAEDRLNSDNPLEPVSRADDFYAQGTGLSLAGLVRMESQFDI
jgi:hypothetical protein